MKLKVLNFCDMLNLYKYKKVSEVPKTYGGLIPISGDDFETRRHCYL